MISSIDSNNLTSTLINQNETALNSPSTASTVTSLATQAQALAKSAAASTATSGSLDQTLNKLVTTLQNLVTSIGKLFTSGGSAANGSPVTSWTNDPYGFLRTVDEEPVTIIPANPRKSGDTASNIGEVSYDDDEIPVTEESKTPPKTTSKAQTVGTALKKSNNEFLWKPVSEKDGKLAVVLPKALTGKVKSVKILSADKTKTLATGKFSGVGNGDREHFRFGKAGSGYPDGAIVVITLEDGSKRNVVIKDTAARFTR
jgi:hypothetical protein